MPIKNFDPTPASNLSSNGISIAENCPFANWNNYARQTSADLRNEIANVGANVASAATPTLDVDGAVVTVTGITTVTGWATAITGLGRTVYYETATPHSNSATLKCPGGVNYTSAKGDVVRWRSFGAGAWASEHYQLATGAPVALPAPATITSSAAGTLLTLTSTDAGAGGGPNLDFYRNSASAAASDILGGFLFNGKDSGGNKTEYANVTTVIVDPTDTTEGGRLRFVTVQAGTSASRFNIESGLYAPTATGGDKGAGTINTKGIYIDGTGVAGPVYVIQNQQTSGTNGGGITSGSFVKRTLNTEVLDQLTVTTTASVVALAAGTYRAHWECTFFAVDKFQTRLQDTTNTVTLGIGNNGSAVAGAHAIGTGVAFFTLAGAANIELQNRVQTTNATDGGGQATSFGTEVYATLVIEKIQ